MTVSIVTCWYEHPELLEDYVAAVEPDLEEGDEVIIIDNGGAPPMPLHFQVFESPRNLGFALGSNAGLDRARGDVVLFLNNDIRLGRPGWLSALKALVEPGVLVGPLRERADLPRAYLDGWCLAGMRKDIRGLGGFDDSLTEPAYYSDCLLCLEASAAGMTLRDARVGLVHKLNVTAGPASSPEVRAASEANRALYIARARELLVAA